MSWMYLYVFIYDFADVVAGSGGSASVDIV